MKLWWMIEMIEIEIESLHRKSVNISTYRAIACDRQFATWAVYSTRNTFLFVLMYLVL